MKMVKGPMARGEGMGRRRIVGDAKAVATWEAAAVRERGAAVKALVEAARELVEAARVLEGEVKEVAVAARA